MQRFDLINRLISKHGYTRYLEIGVDSGETFQRVNCESKESVDPALPPYSYAKPTYEQTSDDFFEQTAPGLEKWDIIFIDGLHHADQVDRDLKNSLKYLKPNGSIVLHDCNPSSELRQRVPRASRRWNGDVWKSIAKHRSQGVAPGCIVVDTDEGLGLLHNSLPVTETFEVEYTYDALVANRQQYLGTVSVKDLDTMEF